MSHDAKPFERPCRACENGANRHSILIFRRTANLCPDHRAIYNKERDRQGAKDGGVQDFTP